MISYELAKELKANGFPQKEQGIAAKIVSKPISQLIVHHPTLSELIEACGDEFLDLRSPKSNSEEYVGVTLQGFHWTARATIGGYNLIESGSTPEEAVARLYIALHTQQ